MACWVETSIGRVIEALHNNVIRQLTDDPGTSFTWDPTAHGERRLISWYYANAAKLSLPAPDQLSVVTSLDLCAQCAGSLTTAGFSAGVIAYDNVAGVNYTLDNRFSGLPERFRPLAQQAFGYYAITDERPHTGSEARARCPERRRAHRPVRNLVAAAPDTFGVCPINTGFMNVVEGYSQARFTLAADPATRQLGGPLPDEPEVRDLCVAARPQPRPDHHDQGPRYLRSDDRGRYTGHRAQPVPVLPAAGQRNRNIRVRTMSFVLGSG